EIVDVVAGNAAVEALQRAVREQFDRRGNEPCGADTCNSGADTHAATLGPAVEITVGSALEIEVDNRVIRVTNPDRIYFPESGATKLDVIEYYLAVGPGIVNALYERPCMLHRFPTGLSGEKVHQKRIPAGAPDWIETVEL